MIGKFEIVVLFQIGHADEQREVDEPLVEAIGHILAVAAEQVEAYAGIAAAHFVKRPAEVAHGSGLSAAYEYVA